MARGSHPDGDFAAALFHVQGGARADWMLGLLQSSVASLIIYVHVDFYICKWIQLD